MDNFKALSWPSHTTPPPRPHCHHRPAPKPLFTRRLLAIFPPWDVLMRPFRPDSVSLKFRRRQLGLLSQWVGSKVGETPGDKHCSESHCNAPKLTYQGILKSTTVRQQWDVTKYKCFVNVLDFFFVCVSVLYRSVCFADVLLWLPTFVNKYMHQLFVFIF